LISPSCDDLVFDLEQGLLSGIAPTASMPDVKTAFPCFTGDTPEAKPGESTTANYGGGVFYNDHGMYFYTRNDFISVRKQTFKGKTDPSVLGVDRTALEKWIDEAPTLSFPPVADVHSGTLLYARPYGCLTADIDLDSTIKALYAHATDCATAAVILGLEKKEDD
jgi:hypothetical protein